MGKILDLTNQKFGHLTVLKDTGERKNRQVVWECECDCSNHTHIKVVGQALRTGHTTSCGCSRKGKNIIDLTNQEFGDLLVLSLSKVDKQRKAWWLCQCKCGEIQEFCGIDLRSGKIRCCHKCTQKNIKYKLNTYEKILNKKFNFLTAIEPTDLRDNGGHILWRCICDCGTECFVSSNSLLTNNTQSCGCKKFSSGEEIIKQILLDNNIKFIRQFNFSDCVSPKNFPLLFDFAVLDDFNKIKCLIEYDGEQHFNPIDFFGGEEGFNYLQKCDKIKNEYCKQNNLKLIRISYKDKDKINFSFLKELGV